MKVTSLQSDHVTRSLRIGVKSFLLLPLQCHHGLQAPLLGSPLSPASRWVFTTKEKSCSGLANPLVRVVPGLCRLLLFPLLQALVMPKSLRLQDIWSKAKDRKQGWLASPKKDTLLCTGINRSRRKSLSFWFPFRTKMLLIKSSCSKSDSQRIAPKPHRAAWKSSPLNRGTWLFISAPAASPQCCDVSNSQRTNTPWARLRKQLARRAVTEVNRS